MILTSFTTSQPVRRRLFVSSCKCVLKQLGLYFLFASCLITALQAQLFNDPVNYGTGGFSPLAVAVGDLNGDHRLDVVVVNENSGSISVLLGNGDGTLQAATTFPAGRTPFFVVLADFNRDGKLDAAVANRVGLGIADVSILLGDGGGGFKLPVSYGPYQDAFSLAVGRFRNNGKLDIAIADTASGSLLMGNGDGTFRDGGSIGVANPLAFAVKDLNHDRFKDLLAASNGARSVVSLLGNGHGSFAQKWNSPISTPPIALAIGDFNRDGLSDVASADEAVNNLGSNVTVFPGNGDGTFGLPVEYPVDAEPVSIAAGKLNRDAKLDLVTANQFGGTLSILLGNGDGSFHPAISIPSGGITPTSVAIGDMNGDGHSDLVVAHPNGDVVSVLLSTGK
jgi:hypothetical protein